MKTVIPPDAVWPNIFPMYQLLLTFWPATFAPMQITLSAVVTLLPALPPRDVLAPPVILPTSAPEPNRRIEVTGSVVKESKGSVCCVVVTIRVGIERVRTERHVT